MTKFALYLVAGLAIARTMSFSSSARGADQPEKAKASAPADSVSQHVQRELAQWKPDHEDLGTIIGKMLQPKAEIVGEWTRSGLMAGSSLSIGKEKSGEYSVSLSTGGCVDDWHLQREGTFARGVVRLNKPVEEYIPLIYDTLYAISVNGTDYLISQADIRFIVKHYSKNGQVDWPEQIKFSGFHRKDEKNNKVPK